MPVFINLILHCSGGPCIVNQEKEIKAKGLEKKKQKPSLFYRYDHLHRKSQKTKLNT